MCYLFLPSLCMKTQLCMYGYGKTMDPQDICGFGCHVFYSVTYRVYAFLTLIHDWIFYRFNRETINVTWELCVFQDYLLGDSTKARTELNWKPKYDFDVSIPLYLLIHAVADLQSRLSLIKKIIIRQKNYSYVCFRFLHPKKVFAPTLNILWKVSKICRKMVKRWLSAQKYI